MKLFNFSKKSGLHTKLGTEHCVNRVGKIGGYFLIWEKYSPSSHQGIHIPV